MSAQILGRRPVFHFPCTTGQPGEKKNTASLWQVTWLIQQLHHAFAVIYLRLMLYYIPIRNKPFLNMMQYSRKLFQANYNRLFQNILWMYNSWDVFSLYKLDKKVKLGRENTSDFCYFHSRNKNQHCQNT